MRVMESNYKFKYTMKKLVVLVLLTVAVGALRAQDLIVTSDNDSLNCKITKLKSDYIYFTFKHKNEVRSTLLPLNQVKYHQLGYYSVAEVPAQKGVWRELYPHFRVGVNGGLSFRMAKLDDRIPMDQRTYARDLMSGSHFSADMAYYFSEQLGVGLMYSRFGASNSMANASLTFPDGSHGYGKLSDDITISFIGPLFSTRLYSRSKSTCFIFNVGLGYLGYNDKAVYGSDLTIKGSTGGFYAGAGYDVNLSEKFALGVQLSLLGGSLTKLKVTNGFTTQTVELPKDGYENLSRIDLSVGLRLNL